MTAVEQLKSNRERLEEELQTLDLTDEDCEALLKFDDVEIGFLHECRNFLDFMSQVSELRPQMRITELHDRYNCVKRYLNKKSGKRPASEIHRDVIRGIL